MDDDFGNDADFLALANAAERNLSPAKPAVAAANSASPQKVTQPTPQALPQRSTPTSILVSPRQKGNPILTHIRALPWEYSDTPADYVLGATTGCLFLSLKYHRLHPEYIYSRIKNLAGKFNLRILLAMVDIDNHEEPLRELAKTSLVNSLTLILAWSAREAARYLEAFKTLEHASPTGIRGQQSAGYTERMVDFVTVPRGVNKADAVGLVSAFGTLRGAINADEEEIRSIQGWGEIKVKRWCSVVREPFRVGRAGKRAGEMGNEDVIPVGRAPVSREITREQSALPDIAPQASDATVVAPQNVVRSWEPGEDNEEALMLAHAEERGLPKATPTAPSSSIPAKRPRPQEPELSESMKAALAKYRTS